jgi:multimeric flavodoxin WrbA
MEINEMRRPLILGFSASLRNARSREGAQELLHEILNCSHWAELHSYLVEQGNIHLEQYLEAGRRDGVPYDILYKELRKMGGKKGLSNSEICLAAALWAAAGEGVAVDFFPLADFFKSDGSVDGLDELKEALLQADGVIVSTPVYFGDRSSLSQRLIEFVSQDKELLDRLSGKVYGGLAVGAKRNGGQETTLIYQLHEMMDLGFVGVGNDYETTSQYGGTGHAGDVSTMSKDEYGLSTCVGTGRRVARVAKSLQLSETNQLVGKLRIGVWILQDRDGEMLHLLAPFLKELAADAEVQVSHFEQKNILPCMACDICPTRVGGDIEFRCIRGEKDDMSALHEEMIKTDIIIPAIFSPKNRMKLRSTYQHLLERTRYLRRSDYILSDRLIAPLIIAEVGSHKNYNLRITTSFIRHHTILQRPIIGQMYAGNLLNSDDVSEGFKSVVANGRRITVGRMAMAAHGEQTAFYKPVGYVLAVSKDNMVSTIQQREEAIKKRFDWLAEESRNRITSLNNS